MPLDPENTEYQAPEPWKYKIVWKIVKIGSIRFPVVLAALNIKIFLPNPEIAGSQAPEPRIYKKLSEDC
jgi:hypothetical protein